ncbi:hypothetical protein [Helicobacter sp. MIT 14-3879]|uniref:hypothetical protein n=1 Tax=Helicobacter sp. MIT 14-3879 TaxID=2040649 RepID=UPI000E1E7BE7|nr:hypothetical protein [Helicobacter sp. MIT 14-3879]RDU59476.1 hypothetical protein CQA44_11420 [Helicobacter sp. MIT 14-3879]
MKNIFPFFLVVCIVFLLYGSIILYTSVLHHQLAYAEMWLSKVYAIKDFINAQPTQKQRILFVGGSSSLFGFDSSIIDANTKFKPINYSTHAGLPLNYHIDRIMNVAKAGDIIFLPLEFSYYINIEPYRNLWYLSNMLAWETYRKYIDKSDILFAYLRQPPLIVIKKFAQTLINKGNHEENIIETMRQVWAANQQKWAGYNYQSLNSYGDFAYQNNTNPYSQSIAQYLKPTFEISTFFVQEYYRLEAFAREHDIKIFLIYPPTMENPTFSIHDEKTYKTIDNLTTQLSKHGIQIYGDFRDFHFDNTYFFDTQNHLNKQGAILRTHAFIKLLQSLGLEKQ